jgi:hypothetical protein
MYLAAYFSGFEIWDLADITSPVRLSRTPTESLSRAGIYVYGDYLFVITYAGGMLVYNVTDPVNPVLITTTPIAGNAYSSCAVDNFIYIITASAIRLYDVSFQSAPVLRDSYPGTARGMYVKGNYGYIAGGTELTVIDVSDPDDLTFAGSLTIPGYPYDVVVSEDVAYVADNLYGGPEGGIYSVDVSDPANPVQMEKYDGYFMTITGVGNKIEAGNSLGYYTFVTQSGHIEPRAQMGLPGFLTNVAVKDNYVYTGSNGFRVFDVSDKSNPQQVAFVDIPGNAIDIAGDIAAYIPESMGDGNRLSIMDISDPENPFETGYFPNQLLTQEAIIHGDYVYIGEWWNGFVVIDISDPSDPSYVTKRMSWYNGAVPGDEWCYVSDIDIEGDYLYVIDYGPFPDDDTKGLYIFDISDPEDPQFISRYQQQSVKSWRIRVKFGFVFLADAEGAVEVIDVSDPTDPQTVAYQELMDVAYNLDVSNGYVYVACYILGGVQVVNVINPEQPVVDGYYYPCGVFGLGVTADDNDVYLADGICGYQIYSHDVIFSGTQKPSLTYLKSSVFPHPSSGMITLNVKNATGVSVFDENGRLVLKKQLKNPLNAIDVSSLPDGIYFLKIKTNEGILLQKAALVK